jgi:hypothetical protein
LFVVNCILQGFLGHIHDKLFADLISKLSGGMVVPIAHSTLLHTRYVGQVVELVGSIQEELEELLMNASHAIRCMHVVMESRDVHRLRVQQENNTVDQELYETVSVDASSQCTSGKAKKTVTGQTTVLSEVLQVVQRDREFMEEVRSADLYFSMTKRLTNRVVESLNVLAKTGLRGSREDAAAAVRTDMRLNPSSNHQVTCSSSSNYKLADDDKAGVFGLRDWAVHMSALLAGEGKVEKSAAL